MNETTTPEKKSKLPLVIGVSLSALILGGLLVFILQSNSLKNNEVVESSGSGNDNYTIEEVGGVDLRSLAPNLDREVQFPANTPLEAQAIMKKQIGDVAIRLKKDMNRADDWFTLGVLYHSASDYEGARDVWNFLAEVVPAPGVATVYENLGKLYKYNLKDFPKSEMYLKKAMTADPKMISPYFELHELYRYLYKTESTLAVDTLISAGAKFPENPDPYGLLGAYYRDRGDKVKALEVYTTALERARKAGNVTQIDGFGAEIEKLSN